jgi:hypothetical protein
MQLYSIQGSAVKVDQHDKNNEKQILKGICKAVDLGYIRKVYAIGPIHGGNGGPSIPTIGIVDMDIDKVAKCCGMSEQEYGRCYRIF